VIRAALNKSGGNVEVAVDLLLSGATIEEEKPKESPDTTNLTQEEADLLLAKKLQEELTMEDKKKEQHDELVAKSLSQEEQDEIFARQLMMDEMKQNQSRSYATNHTNFTTKNTHQAPMMNLDQIDEGVVNELLNQIKSTFIPFISEQLQGFEVPDIEEQIDTGKVGEVAFSVKDVSMSDVNVPPEGVTMKLVDQGIRLEVNDISAKLQEFSWAYEKKSGFPKLKDSGKGTAGISGTKIIVEMALHVSEMGPSLNVQSTTVNIDKLDLKISGTAMSLLYNLVLAAFKKTIKSTIENALANMVTDAVNNNIGDLMQVFE